jgi:RNA polymerase sigma factor (sigma-70 family)
VLPRRDGEVNRLLRTLFDAGSVVGQSDGRLVRRLALGGASADLAFAALVERHGPMVLRVCRRVLRDPHEAHDAFQATFLVLARRAASIRDPEAVASWLHGVALRAARTLRTQAERRRRHERQAAAMRSALTVPAPATDPDLAAALHEEIARLPARERSVVVLCDLEDWSYEQAARQLGCPLGTVKSRLSTARRRLRGRLARRGLAPTAAGLSAALAAEAGACVLPHVLRESTIEAAGILRAAGSAAKAAGVVPAPAAALAEGVIRTMSLGSKFKAITLVAGAVAVSGAFMAAQAFQQPTTPADGDRLGAIERKLDRLIGVLERSAPGGQNPVNAANVTDGVTFRFTETNEPAQVTTGVATTTVKSDDGAPVTVATGRQSGRDIDASTLRARGLEEIREKLDQLEARIERLERHVFAGGQGQQGGQGPQRGATTSADTVLQTK